MVQTGGPYRTGAVSRGDLVRRPHEDEARRLCCPLVWVPPLLPASHTLRSDLGGSLRCLQACLPSGQRRGGRLCPPQAAASMTPSSWGCRLWREPQCPLFKAVPPRLSQVESGRPREHWAGRQPGHRPPAGQPPQWAPRVVSEAAPAAVCSAGGAGSRLSSGRCCDWVSGGISESVRVSVRVPVAAATGGSPVPRSSQSDSELLLLLLALL